MTLGSLLLYELRGLLFLLWFSPRGSPGVFQRTKSLTHVAEIANGGVRLVELGLPWRCSLRRAPAAASDIEDDEQSSDDKQGD